MTDKETTQKSSQESGEETAVEQEQPATPEETTQETAENTEETETIDESETSVQEPQEEPHDRLREATESIKETSEKFWENTRQVWSSATFKANQYKKLVQKRIDLSAVHKKITTAHGDLGRLIDDLRNQGQKSIMANSEVKQILERLDSLKAEAAMLEEEIDTIREAEAPHQED